MTNTWQHVCAISKLSEDEPLGVKLGEQRIALYKVDGKVFATDDVCSHAFALLSTGFLDAHAIECPLHGGIFDVRDGKCRAGGYKDIRAFAVDIRDGEIFVKLDVSEVAS